MTDVDEETRRAALEAALRDLYVGPIRQLLGDDAHWLERDGQILVLLPELGMYEAELVVPGIAGPHFVRVSRELVRSADRALLARGLGREVRGLVDDLEQALRSRAKTTQEATP